MLLLLLLFNKITIQNVFIRMLKHLLILLSHFLGTSKRILFSYYLRRRTSRSCSYSRWPLLLLLWNRLLWWLLWVLWIEWLLHLKWLLLLLILLHCRFSTFTKSIKLIQRSLRIIISIIVIVVVMMIINLSLIQVTSRVVSLVVPLILPLNLWSVNAIQKTNNILY